MTRLRAWLCSPASLRAAACNVLACGVVACCVAACSAAGGETEDTPVLPAPGGAGGASEPVATAGTGGGGGSSGAASVPPIDVEPGDATQLCGTSLAGPPVLRRLTRREVENSLRDIFPVLGADWRSLLSADTVAESGFDNDNNQLLVSRQTARELADTAESVGTAVAAAVGQVLPCATTAPDASCAGQLLDGVGRRLFRRPLSEAERSSLLGFFDTAQTATGDFAQGIGWLTRALIESPSFVYRRELGTAQGDGTQLDQYEVATELAFTFTGSGPDDALLDRASRAELSSPEVLEAAARELLGTPRGQEVIQSFFDSFVGHSRVTSIAKAEVDQFAALRQEMLNETRSFVEEVIINRGGGYKELFTANITTPTEALSTFYVDFPVPASPHAVVERPAGRGIGLLAQGAVLATLSQPNGSSPTKRGLWIYKHLLCNNVPNVPPDIPELGPPQPGERTTRQRYEEDHAQGECQGCHSMWDPIGFGFEHFDEAGRYREQEGNLPIDTSSRVQQRGQTLFEFDGQEDLMTQLVEQPIVSQCMSGFITTFAFGEEVSCAGESRRAEFMDGSIGFVDYLASLAAEPHFTQRRVAVP
jgi:hypothetical protein